MPKTLGRDTQDGAGASPAGVRPDVEPLLPPAFVGRFSELQDAEARRGVSLPVVEL